MTLSEFERIYKDQQYVGSGGFAQVFKTFDHAKGHYVAIKRAPVRPENKQYTLQREVDLVNKLPLHDNIARYDACYRFDMGLAGEIDFAILKFYEDGNLEQFLRSRTITPEDERIIIRGILRGISFLHQNNYIHRDLKSQNILLQRENGVWSPKITDFGLARVVADNTVTDTSVGLSYAYASPEQIQNRKITKNVDLWSAGVIIYRIVAGELPFKNEAAGEEHTSRSQSELIRKIIQLELPSKLSTLAEPYQSMIRRCLVLDTQARTQSADELLLMLDGGQSFQAPSYQEDFEKTTLLEPAPVASWPPPIEPAPAASWPPPVEPPRPPAVEEEKTRIMRPVYQPPTQAEAPVYIPPPTNDYIPPKSDFTQIINKPVQDPAPPPPMVPSLNMGEPSRGFNWWWVLIPVLLIGIALGVYYYLSIPKDTTPTIIAAPVVIAPPVTVPKGNWKANYKEAVDFASSDHHSDGHHNTFYLLKLAAQIAIQDKESKDMLKQMAADKSKPAVNRLTHGHQEWSIIENALRNNDFKLLETIVSHQDKDRKADK